MLEAAPGEPDDAVTLTPATCPCNACSIRVGFNCSMDSLETTDTAPVTSFLRCVPYPMTTISSRVSAELSNETLIVVLLTTTSFDL